MGTLSFGSLLLSYFLVASFSRLIISALTTASEQSVVLLATIILVNAIWRAVGALAARIDLMSKTRQDHDKLNN